MTCIRASENTSGEFICTREPGHDGPCAAWPAAEWAHEKLVDFPDRLFPHCDSRVLHAPGVCKYCDMHSDWQALRILWRINFTGESYPTKRPCPAEMLRSVQTIHQWHGNRPDGV